jgi:hypothetical protein
MLLLRNENVSKAIVEDKATGLLNVFYASCLDMQTINAYGGVGWSVGWLVVCLCLVCLYLFSLAS